MKQILRILPLALLVGCADEAVQTSAPPTRDPVATMETKEAITVSYSAGDSATLAVPEMSCAVMCYPKVKETLEKLDGVSVVELVPQEEEGVINDRRVTVKFEGDVESEAAVAALTDAGYPESRFE